MYLDTNLNIHEWPTFVVSEQNVLHIIVIKMDLFPHTQVM
jgi:hypothetical protein